MPEPLVADLQLQLLLDGQIDLSANEHEAGPGIKQFH